MKFVGHVPVFHGTRVVGWTSLFTSRTVASRLLVACTHISQDKPGYVDIVTTIQYQSAYHRNTTIPYPTTVTITTVDIL